MKRAASNYWGRLLHFDRTVTRIKIYTEGTIKAFHYPLIYSTLALSKIGRIGDEMGWLIAITSMFFSVLFFIFTYGATVGADGRKTRWANKELEEMLFRRVVSEKYIPSLEEVRMLIEGKAQEYSLKASALQGEMDLLTVTYTKVVANDFIPEKRRKDLIKNLVPLLQKCRAEENKKGVAERLKELARLAGLVLAAASIGWLMGAGLLVTVYEWEGLISMSMNVLGLLALLPLLAATALAWAYRIRARASLLPI
jgi:hypothetical protein